MQNTKFIFLFILISIFSFGQKKDTIHIKNGIDRPNILPIHHFGLFSARINQNFKTRVPQKSTFIFTLSSANTFHPFVEMYLPENESDRKLQREQIWFNRRFTFIDQKTTPSKYSNIVVDAVFKNLRIDFNTKINKNQELSITLRSYLVTKGKYPFSFFTNDQTIEWFHSNIAGGEDPFGRKYYGLDQVNVKYQDRNEKTLALKDGQFLIGGIEFNHFYYPDIINLKEKNIGLNFGSHLGINTSKFNPSIDIGFSGNIIKKWILKSDKEIRSSFGTALLRKNILNFKDVMDLGNNKFLGSTEAMVEFTKYTAKKNYYSVSVNYQIQTPFFKRQEADYYQLIGKWEEIHSGWQNGFEKMYEYLSSWSWLYSFGTKKYTFAIYVKEDLYLNNSPDIQTGISLKIPLSN